MNVFIYVLLIWLIGALITMAFVYGANKKEDENYRED